MHVLCVGVALYTSSDMFWNRIVTASLPGAIAGLDSANSVVAIALGATVCGVTTIVSALTYLDKPAHQIAVSIILFFTGGFLIYTPTGSVYPLIVLFILKLARFMICRYYQDRHVTSI